MRKPHWIPFYANDFLASSKVSLLTTEEVGAYVFLLCHAWQDPQCSLPDDDGALSILGRMKGDMTNVRTCFIRKRGRLVNERLYQEWIKAKEQKELSSLHGKQGAMKRWMATPLATPLGLAIRNDSSSSSSSPLKKEEKKKMPLRATAMVDSDWLTELGQNPAYRHINLAVEIGKMEAWLNLPRNAKRHKTRSFVLNWLNKVEVPMQLAPTQTPSSRPTKVVL